MYLGLALPEYPGDAVLSALKATGQVSFLGVPLGPVAQRPPASWRPHLAAAAAAAGWCLAVSFTGGQDPVGLAAPVLAGPRGATDAGEAIACAQEAQLPPGSVIYLNLPASSGIPLSGSQVEYASAWAGALRASSFRPGLNCPSAEALQITDAAGLLAVWVRGADVTRGTSPQQDPGTSPQEDPAAPAAPAVLALDRAAQAIPDPAGGGYEQALLWQDPVPASPGPLSLTWTDEAGTGWTLEGASLISAVVPDPSRPFLPMPVITEVSPPAAAAGDTVRISGENFTGVTGLVFGTVPAARLTVDGDIALEAVVPDGLTGQSVRLLVTNRWNLSGQTIDPFTVTAAPVPDPRPEPAVNPI